MIKIFIFSLITNLLFYSYGHLIKSTNVIDKIEGINNKSIYGVILISFLALTLNFFFPLNKEINTLILFSGLLILLSKRKFHLGKLEITYIVVSALITASLLLYSNINTPDAGLYHLPYVSVLNEHKIIFGLSNIHFRFGHTSIIQYLSAANNNYIFGDIGVLLPLASIVSFFIIFFLNKVYNIIKNPDNVDLGNIFSIFILIYISYKINRYSSFGNDAVAHLSYFYLISNLLSNNKLNINFITLIAVFIFLNKTTMILSLLIPLFFILEKFNLSKLKILFSIPSFFLLFWLLKNIFISGCLIYPLEITCLERLNWTDIAEVKKESTSGEAWSKGWSDRNDLSDKNINKFNKNFNWLKTWASVHGIYIIKILIPYLILSLFILFYISDNKNSSKTFDRSTIKIPLLISLFGSVMFFLKFPMYRYGYSYFVTFLFYVSCSYKNVFLKKIKNIKIDFNYIFNCIDI